MHIWGFPSGANGEEFASQCRRHGFDPWVGKTPWRRKWQSAPVFLPGKFHGQKILAGDSPQGCKELDMNEQLNTHIHTCYTYKVYILCIGRELIIPFNLL